jgi:hypothetical protein
MTATATAGARAGRRMELEGRRAAPRTGHLQPHVPVKHPVLGQSMRRSRPGGIPPFTV